MEEVSIYGWIGSCVKRRKLLESKYLVAWSPIIWSLEFHENRLTIIDCAPTLIRSRLISLRVSASGWWTFLEGVSHAANPPPGVSVALRGVCSGRRADTRHDYRRSERPVRRRYSRR